MIAQFDFRSDRFGALGIIPAGLSSSSQPGATLFGRILKDPSALCVVAPPTRRQVSRQEHETLTLTSA
jgi:hypothetical protein